MRKLASIALLSLTALSFASSVAVADGTDMPLPTDNRIKILTYDESDVYTITTKYGYQTNIVFDRGEEVQTISVGDRSLWQIVPAGNRMFIRPMDNDVMTNMTILTNRRSYQFDLKSVSSDTDEPIYVAKFSYPDNKPAPKPTAQIESDRSEFVPAEFYTAAAAPPAPSPAAPRISMRPASGPGVSYPVHPNYNYTYSGPDALAPLQVYDDGRYTHILYSAPRKILPNLYRLESGGKEFPVRYTVRGNALMVDGIASEWSLKDSDGTIRIYNEMLNPR